MVVSEYASGLETFSNLPHFIWKATSALQCFSWLLGKTRKSLFAEMPALLIKKYKKYANSAPVDKRRYSLYPLLFFISIKLIRPPFLASGIRSSWNVKSDVASGQKWTFLLFCSPLHYSFLAFVTQNENKS